MRKLRYRIFRLVVYSLGQQISQGLALAQRNSPIQGSTNGLPRIASTSPSALPRTRCRSWGVGSSARSSPFALGCALSLAGQPTTSRRPYPAMTSQNSAEKAR